MLRRALPLAGIAALAAVPAQAAVSDFRLPPAPSPTPTPRVEGPIDPELPRPVAAPTPTPSPTPAPAPSPAPRAAPAGAAGTSATPVIQPLPSPSARPSPGPTPRPSARPSPTPSPAATSAAGTPAPSPRPTASAGTVPLPAFTPAPGAAAAPAAAAAADAEVGLPWGWIGAVAALLALAGFGLWLRRRSAGPRATVLIVPEIERPRVPDKPAAPEGGGTAAAPPAPTFVTTGAAAPVPPEAPEPAAAAHAEHPLHIRIEPLKLTQTMMNMTLGYRLELTNRGSDALSNLAVAADLVGAHASLPREAQLAAPDSALAEQHRVASLPPGETVALKGELRLPLANVVPIRQGSAVVLVPLARFRTSSDGEAPRCFTVVVGQPGANGAIQPYRLDIGLRSVEGLTGRAF